VVKDKAGKLTASFSTRLVCIAEVRRGADQRGDHMTRRRNLLETDTGKA